MHSSNTNRLFRVLLCNNSCYRVNEYMYSSFKVLIYQCNFLTLGFARSCLWGSSHQWCIYSVDLYCEMFVCSVQHICEYPFLSNPAYHVVSCADTGLCLIVCFVYCDNFFFFGGLNKPSALSRGCDFVSSS